MMFTPNTKTELGPRARNLGLSKLGGYLLPHVSLEARYALGSRRDPQGLVRVRSDAGVWCTKDQMGHAPTPEDAMRAVERVLGLPECPVVDDHDDPDTVRWLAKEA